MINRRNRVKSEHESKSESSPSRVKSISKSEKPSYKYKTSKSVGM